MQTARFCAKGTKRHTASHRKNCGKSSGMFSCGRVEVVESEEVVVVVVMVVFMIMVVVEQWKWW